MEDNNNNIENIENIENTENRILPTFDSLTSIPMDNPLIDGDMDADEIEIDTVVQPEISDAHISRPQPKTKHSKKMELLKKQYEEHIAKTRGTTNNHANNVKKIIEDCDHVEVGGEYDPSKLRVVVAGRVLYIDPPKDMGNEDPTLTGRVVPHKSGRQKQAVQPKQPTKKTPVKKTLVLKPGYKRL